MKALITGAAGFIGSHLADHLIEKGWDVVGVDNMLTGSEENVNPKVKLYRLDFSDYFGDIASVINDEDPDYVFHLGAIARTPWTIDDPLLSNQVNITGTLQVLEAARKVGGIRKVVLASSNIVYAEETPYKVQKETLEGYAKVYDKLYDLPTLCLRFSNVYGSNRQSMKGPSPNVLASLRKSMLEKGFIEITGDGEQSRDFTHVLDVVEALYLAATSDVRGTEIDICTGHNVSMNQIAKYFPCEVRYIGERLGDIKHIEQNPTKARELLGFKAKRMLKDNIQVYTQSNLIFTANS